MWRPGTRLSYSNSVPILHQCNEPYGRLGMSVGLLRCNIGCCRASSTSAYSTSRPESCLDKKRAGMRRQLCQSVAYLSQTVHFSCGVLSCSGPLYFAAHWSRTWDATQRLAWTQYVRHLLEHDYSLKRKGTTLHKLNPLMFLHWMMNEIH